jgi:hypothetical protein
LHSTCFSFTYDPYSKTELDPGAISILSLIMQTFFFFVSGLDNPDKHASDLTLSKTIILDNHCSSFRTEEGMTYTLLRNAA